MSNEPSMEEILSSIKRIIAEDNDDSVAASARAERRARVREQSRRRIVEADFDLDEDDEVLELTGGVAAPYGQSADSAGKDAVMGNDSEYVKAIENAVPSAATRVSAIPTGRKRAAPAAIEAEAEDNGIVSPESETAARSSLAALSSMVMKPQAEGETNTNTLEGLVREMLRPMLKQWLDANLPELVEGMVAKEIARITGRPL